MGQRADEMSAATQRDMASTDGMASAPEDDEVASARAQIEQTRAELGETIDAIQDRLAPQHLAEQAKETVRAATVGKVEDAVSTATGKVQELVGTAGEKASATVGAVTQGVQQALGTSGTAGTARTTQAPRSLIDTIRQHPLPVALTGIGLSWLYLSTRGRNTQPATYYQPYAASPPYQPSTSGTSPTQVFGKVQDTAGQLAGTATERMNQVAGSAGDSLSQLGSRATDATQRATGGLGEVLERNPLAVGAATVALGMVAGLMVPQTEQENQVLGQAHDAVMDRASQVAQEATLRVQSVAQHAASAAKEAVQQDLRT